MGVIMIQVADGQWNEGMTLYFINPSNKFGMPIIAKFVPVYPFLLGDNIIPYFMISQDDKETRVISSELCYLNRDTVFDKVGSAKIEFTINMTS